MKKNFVLFFMVFCLFSALAQAKKEGPKETMWAKVTLHVDWNKRNENSGEVRQGVMNLSLSGTLKLNRDFSGQVDKGRFAPLLSYALQNSTYAYNYKEDWSIFRQDNPPKCPNPQRTLQKTGSVAGDEDGPPMNLIIHYHAGLVIMPPPQVADVLIDYYEFVAQVPAQTAEGKSKVLDSKTHHCKEIDQSDPILDGEIKIFFKIGPDGKMSGSKSWSSQTMSNNFSVAVSDLPDSFKKKPAKPEPRGKNDVHYSLTWELGAAPVGQIEREMGGNWFDVTGIDQDVLTGEEIKLRGLVAPRSLDKAAGKWEISNWKGVVPVRGFDDSFVPLELKPELGKKELTLQFCGGGETEITYTARAGGQEVTAKVKFKVKARAK